MDAEPQRNRPTPGNATLSQARKSKALLGLKYSRAGGTPTVHPRFHPGPGSPQLIGLTSRITEKSPQVARVSHAPVAPFTLNPLRRTPCHQTGKCETQPTLHLLATRTLPEVSRDPLSPGGTLCCQCPGVRHPIKDQPDTCQETPHQGDTCV